jgi:hypothetical protein
MSESGLLGAATQAVTNFHLSDSSALLNVSTQAVAANLVQLSDSELFWAPTQAVAKDFQLSDSQLLDADTQNVAPRNDDVPLDPSLLEAETQPLERPKVAESETDNADSSENQKEDRTQKVDSPDDQKEDSTHKVDSPDDQKEDRTHKLESPDDQKEDRTQPTPSLQRTSTQKEEVPVMDVVDEALPPPLLQQRVSTKTDMFEESRVSEPTTEGGDRPAELLFTDSNLSLIVPSSQSQDEFCATRNPLQDVDSEDGEKEEEGESLLNSSGMSENLLLQGDEEEEEYMAAHEDEDGIGEASSPIVGRSRNDFSQNLSAEPSQNLTLSQPSSTSSVIETSLQPAGNQQADSLKQSSAKKRLLAQTNYSVVSMLESSVEPRTGVSRLVPKGLSSATNYASLSMDETAVAETDILVKTTSKAALTKVTKTPLKIPSAATTIEDFADLASPLLSRTVSSQDETSSSSSSLHLRFSSSMSSAAPVNSPVLGIRGLKGPELVGRNRSALENQEKSLLEKHKLAESENQDLPGLKEGQDRLEPENHELLEDQDQEVSRTDDQELLEPEDQELPNLEDQGRPESENEELPDLEDQMLQAESRNQELAEEKFGLEDQGSAENLEEGENLNQSVKGQSKVKFTTKHAVPSGSDVEAKISESDSPPRKDIVKNVKFTRKPTFLLSCRKLLKVRGTPTSFVTTCLT